MGWQEEVIIHQIEQNEFYLEVKVDELETKQRLWIIFLHASTEEMLRKEQWEELIDKKTQWGENWIIGGDFNDVRIVEEKN